MPTLYRSLLLFTQHRRRVDLIALHAGMEHASSSALSMAIAVGKFKAESVRPRRGEIADEDDFQSILVQAPRGQTSGHP
jgi:hypothetical protein